MVEMSSAISPAFIIFFTIFTLSSGFVLEDKFEEELYLKPLPSGHIYSTFQFTTIWNVPFEAQSCKFLRHAPFNFISYLLRQSIQYLINFMYLIIAVHHCHLFPRALGEILGHYNVQELHLSLTEGLWRHEKFGYPVNDAPPGAELWAWFKEGTVE